MDVFDAIRNRRSIRKYKKDPVEDEKITKCLEAARWAPSASNRQPWHFIVVRDEKTRKKLSDMHPYGRFMRESPVVIALAFTILIFSYSINTNKSLSSVTIYSHLPSVAEARICLSFLSLITV
ncbi:MAG: nitroreductase family protein [Methanomicrobia archaeon]|nr:nitroreductase family protein [Methanomicrobia archaeon]